VSKKVAIIGAGPVGLAAALAGSVPRSSQMSCAGLSLSAFAALMLLRAK
jgi:thioredoxin reductase